MENHKPLILSGLAGKKLIVVLGMHRSGTSAITRGLQVMGVGLGERMMPPVEWNNTKGFWEDIDLNSLNIEILKAIESGWHHLAPIEISHIEKLRNEGYLLRAVELLSQKISSAPIFGFKDPRVAKLLPFWKEVFSHCQFNVNYVLAMRHPLSVVKSLAKRDGLAAEQSYLLWLGHVIESLTGSAGSKRVLVDYDRLMQSPDGELMRIAKSMDLKIDPAELQSYKTEFLDQELRHTVYDLNDLLLDNACPPIVREVYVALLDVASDKARLEDVELQNKIVRWSDEYERLKSPLLLADRLFTQKAAAMHDVAEREGQIASLTENVAERDGRIASLNQTVAERDGRIVSLNQAVSERDGQVVNLGSAVLERDMKIRNLQLRTDELQGGIQSIHLSNSWRITKPMRAVSRLVRNFSRLIRVYKNYRQVNPGVGGLVRLAGRCVDAIQKGGVKSLRGSIALLERNGSTAPPSRALVLMLNETVVNNVTLPKDVAVHAHVFYPDLASELRTYLEHIPVDFHFYVTTDTAEKAKCIEEIFSGMKNVRALDIRIVENRGRDIAPMIVSLGAALAQHEIVLHLHTKRSPHNVILRGWRRYLLESLLGNPQRIAAILQQFKQAPTLGILFPTVFNPVRPCVNIGGNYQNMTKLLGRGGKGKWTIESVRQDFFPAGSMFWIRGKAIAPFVKMQLKTQDFEHENGQDDATLAHALERMFVYFAGDVGLQSWDYSTYQFDPDSGVSGFDWFRTYLARGIIQRSVVIFDHDRGGGANAYSQILIDDIVADNTDVLRCFYKDNSWFVDWIKAGDGMLFTTADSAELFDTLAQISGSRVEVNSLYGYPNIELVAQQIIGLSNTLSVPLVYKAHDFHALCPSPHLLDFKDEYCGVPEDHAICSNCLKNNSRWYIKESWADDIDEWRRPFAQLIKKAENINFFDSSTIEIYRQVFQIEDSKVHVTPHEDDYFKCSQKMNLSGPLHVGVLGTLTIVKGGKIVNALSNYMGKQGMRIPITIVGSCLLPTEPEIEVLGPYEVRKLSDIVCGNCINAILMPSIVPETFSYTISEAMKMGLPIVAFDLGAQGSRVKQYELGKVVPVGSSPEVILAALQSVLKSAQELNR